MLYIIIIIFLISSNIAFAKNNVINITFTKENAKHWQYISDRTMGGISDGQAVLDKEGDIYFARLTGNVSTKNNGGFIQLRSTLTFINFDKKMINLKGVRLKVRGNGEVYHIFIRTSETRSYRDYFAATFIANSTNFICSSCDKVGDSPVVPQTVTPDIPFLICQFNSFSKLS